MRLIADFHIHSKYSRAVSKNMVLPEVEKWAVKKGIDVISCSDFTHPLWFRELKEKLEPAEDGLYRLKQKESELKNSGIRFIFTTEISCIYSKGGKGRRVHLLVFAPSLTAVEKINSSLNWRGNLKSDGRPILGLDAKELLKIILDVSPEAMMIPAHIWTPWFSVFGSKSGFNSLEECFDELAPQIYAIETGLSSDSSMNWRIPELDNRTIISGSDAHSLPNLGREACVFEIEKEKLSYPEIARIIKEKDVSKFLRTLEFFPEEGMYHFDGHRDCEISLSPSETKKQKGMCPKCGKGVTVGVMNRVEELALQDRPEGFNLTGAVPYKNLVPLQEIVSEAFEIGVNTKSVSKQYEKLTRELKNEFYILLDASREEIELVSNKKIAEGVMRVREGRVKLTPGYDGQYGKAKVFEKGEEFENKNKQKSLF